MRKIWIASDSTKGRMLTVGRQGLHPIDLAYEFGRAEQGEIIHIWDDENTDRKPDHMVYWDNVHRRYSTYSA